MYTFCDKACGEKFTDNCVFTKYDVEGMDVEVPSVERPSRFRRMGRAILSGTLKVVRGMNYVTSYPLVQPGDLEVPSWEAPPKRKYLSADIGQAVVDNCVLDHAVARPVDPPIDRIY